MLTHALWLNHTLLLNICHLLSERHWALYKLFTAPCVCGLPEYLFWILVAKIILCSFFSEMLFSLLYFSTYFPLTGFSLFTSEYDNKGALETTWSKTAINMVSYCSSKKEKNLKIFIFLKDSCLTAGCHKQTTNYIPSNPLKWIENSKVTS